MVSIICCTMRERFMDNVFQNYDNQTWKEKELIIILNCNDLQLEKWSTKAKSHKNVFVYQLPEEQTLGECLNFAIQRTNFSYIAKFDDDDYYAPQYLDHMMETLHKTKADIVGKRAVYMYFQEEKLLTVNNPERENKFVRQGLKGATLLFHKRICEKVTFPNLNLGEDTFFLRQCVRNHFKLYATDKKNYACIRLSHPGHHTWNVHNKYLLRKAAIVCKTEDFRPFIIK